VLDAYFRIAIAVKVVSPARPTTTAATATAATAATATTATAAAASRDAVREREELPLAG
jgi:hypothetical protein